MKELHVRLEKMCLVPFMPETLKTSFKLSLEKGYATAKGDIEEFTELYSQLSQENSTHVSHTESDGKKLRKCIQFGRVKLYQAACSNRELVPDTLFYEVESQSRYLQDIALDVSHGEKHILLIGNQGK